MFSAERALAEQMADAAGEIVMRRYCSRLDIEDKPDASPVTAADKESERAMRDMIHAQFPDHGIFGEEWGRENLGAEKVWVLDPIDGTKAFVTGKPLFGNLIGMMRNGEAVVGVINAPAMQHRWVGAKDDPTTFNGDPVRCRQCRDLSHAWMYSTTPDMFTGSDETAHHRLRAAVKHTIWGADCYAFGLLANGLIDLVVEADLKPYDYCAVIPVIEGAGGIVTDWQGKPLGLESDGRLIAAGDPDTHAQALEVLNT